jgi:hypothetical protein
MKVQWSTHLVTNSLIQISQVRKYFYSFSKEEFYGPKPSDLGLKIEEFTFTNEKTNNIIISSISDTKILLESIVAVSSKKIFSKGSLMISSDAIIKEGEVTLFLNNQEDKLGLYKDLESLYGAHHNVWGKEGLSRCWRGVIVETKKQTESQEEELIEKLSSGVRITKIVPGVKPNLVKHPKKVVFCVSDSKLPSLSKLNHNEAVELFEKSNFSLKTNNFGSISTKEQVERFKEILEQSNAEIFALNVSKLTSSSLKELGLETKVETTEKVEKVETTEKVEKVEKVEEKKKRKKTVKEE